ncbi:hypothetical protein SOVF_013040 [Spinacia oleracea]|nr:hypothetical protein SOVF_013040 [Spinacia oleracea]
MTETKVIDASSPYYLHPTSNTSIVISPVVLRGENYEEWARSMRNAFKANNKIGFFDGTIEPPTTEEPDKMALWVQVNSMLGAWIHNTLDASIRSSIPLTDNVKDMWDDIR